MQESVVDCGSIFGTSYMKEGSISRSVMTSKVGISQGSVISPVLCNLHTHGSMKEVLKSFRIC